MLDKEHLLLNDNSCIESIIDDFKNEIRTGNVCISFLNRMKYRLNSIQYSPTLRALYNRLSEGEGLFIGEKEMVSPALLLADVLQEELVRSYRKITGNFVQNYAVVEPMYNLAKQLITTGRIKSYILELLSYKGEGAHVLRIEHLVNVFAACFTDYFSSTEESCGDLVWIVKESISELICMDMYDYTSPRVDLCLPNGEVIWIQNKLYNSSSELARITQYAVEHRHQFYLDWERILKSTVNFRESVDLIPAIW